MAKLNFGEIEDIKELEHYGIKIKSRNKKKKFLKAKNPNAQRISKPKKYNRQKVDKYE